MAGWSHREKAASHPGIRQKNNDHSNTGSSHEGGDSVIKIHYEIPKELTKYNIVVINIITINYIVMS